MYRPNHCGQKSQDVEKVFFAFFCEKTTSYKKFSKFCSKSFLPDTDRRVVFKFREIWRTEVGKVERCLPDEKQNFAC